MKQGFTCYSCIHCKQTKSNKPGYPTKRLCEITKRWGSMNLGYDCSFFSYKQRPNAIGTDGIPIKNKQPLDYRTSNQWLEAGRKIKQNAVGLVMHSNSHSLRTYTYYLIEDTEQC